MKSAADGGDSFITCELALLYYNSVNTGINYALTKHYFTINANKGNTFNFS